MKNLLQKIKKWYSAMPEKKRHVELITAFLSVPMMVTVILVNLNNIKNQKEQKTLGVGTTTPPIQVVIDNPNATASPTQIQTATPTTTKTTGTVTVTPTATPTVVACKNDIGPVSILSPQESEIITTDKVNINISADSAYCPMTWSYKLDNDNWSDFTNNNISLYNLTPGRKQIQIRVKNAAGDKTITLERNFIYQSSTMPVTTPSATPSATINQ